MSWTPITGTANYANGKTATPGSGTPNGGTPALDPVLNTSGTQDYTTLYTGGKGKTITPGSGLSNVAAPSAPQAGGE